VLIGVGEASERPEDPGYEGLSPVELAAKAVRAALEDTGKPAVASEIDAVATIRQFENSHAAALAPFGRSNNFPRSVASRIGADPKRAVLEVVGGHGPQHLINEFAAAIASGAHELVLLAGAEAISTVRHLTSKGEKRDWSEQIDGSLEDRGYGLKGVMSLAFAAHKLTAGPVVYSLLENARRRARGLSRADYAQREMGALFSRFSQVSVGNPHASSRTAYSPEQLAAVGERNRLIADPFTLRFVSRDQVNQGAAVILTSVAKARQLGIEEKKWIYLHGYADLREREVLERADLSKSPAAVLAVKQALEAAGIAQEDIRFFDLYSCFPIAVLNVLDGLGLKPNDLRGFTLTGGLPYFGGAGNNYSMHGVACMARKLRAHPGSYGLLGANGGYLSKYSVGVFSTTPRAFKLCDSKPLQTRLDAEPAPAVAYDPEGWAKIETYTVIYNKGEAQTGAVIGRLEGDGRRFVAITADEDSETVRKMVDQEPLGQRIYVQPDKGCNRFAFSDKALAARIPSAPAVLRTQYEFNKVERRGHLLEVTINRPEVRNSLHPPAHEELDEIFDSFLADADLWVAIVTGAGTEAFCAGNDLKYQASGRQVYMPKGGFGGLTRRLSRPKPVIAAVNGFAMGGGFEICLACDLVVADERAQFALSEVRVGLVAGAGGVVRLPRQIPRKAALELILTGRKIGAERALELGIINRITPAGSALEGARELAAEILEGSPTSVRCSLELISQTDQIAAEAQAAAYRSKIFDELATSEDAFEGVSAFVHKRKPEWKNR
jgi:acetyl-CoA C-acetyltransferase